MSKEVKMIIETIPSQKQANELLEKLLVVASPKAVYSDPVEAGEYKVITASEVSIGLGYGYGGAGGFEGKGSKKSGDADTVESSSEGEDKAPATGGFGTGGGGGGGTVSRPVAAIEIGPHGVRVEPIVDPTKIALAFFTTILSMLGMMGKMRRARRRGR